MIAGWTDVALGDVASIDRQVVDPDQIRAGTLYVGLENLVPGGGLRDVTAVVEGQIASAKFAFDRRHVLFGKLRPNLAKSARPDFAGVCSTDILPIKPGRTIDRDYLAHFLARPDTVALATQRSSGANLPRLGPKELERFRLPLPPLNQQRRIARVLDAGNHLRSSRRRSIASANALAPAWLDSSAGLPDSNVISRCALAELVVARDRINYGVLQPGEHVTDGVPLIRVGDLIGGRVRRERLKAIAPELEAPYERSRIVGTEVLVSCVGSIGLVATVTPAEVGSNIARAIARIPIDSPQLRTFVAAYLQTPAVRRYFVSQLRTVAQPTLNIKQIRELEVPVPTERWLDGFYARMMQIDQVRDHQAAHLRYLETLVASLQHRAFSGEL